MKQGNILLAFILLFVLSCTNQLPEKASPFTAVEWKNDLPKVQFKGEWYFFEGLDGLSHEQILDHCKERYNNRWKKRFSEDLIEVLDDMGYTPKLEVELTLRKDQNTQLFKGTLTEQNRRLVWQYNKSKELESKKIAKQEASKDLLFLLDKIEDHYSYADLKIFDYKTKINELIGSLNKEIPYTDFAIEIQKIVSKFGDGHSRVSGISSVLPSGYLPFVVKPYKSRVICINHEKQELLNKDYPYLKSVNGVPIDSLLKESSKIVADGSGQFVVQQSIKKLAHIKYLLEVLNVALSDTLQIELANDQSQFIGVVLPVSNYMVELQSNDSSPNLPEKIGYIKIGRMISDDDAIAELIQSIDEQIESHGLIIDIRNNPGGSRKILKELAPYFLPKGHTPVVINTAVYRTNDTIFNTDGYLANRYLFPVTSKEFDEADLTAISKFDRTFKPEWRFPKHKFSQWHYFLVSADDRKSEKYEKPVVVLINADCYSAADIFAAAFKELPNVTLLGKATGGGSGRSKGYKLPHSGIVVRLSTMASFQPSGQLYDGNGVSPDIEIEETISDILGKSDSQLDKAVEVIKEKMLTGVAVAQPF